MKLKKDLFYVIVLVAVCASFAVVSQAQTATTEVVLTSPSAGTHAKIKLVGTQDKACELQLEIVNISGGTSWAMFFRDKEIIRTITSTANNKISQRWRKYDDQHWTGETRIEIASESGYLMGTWHPIGFNSNLDSVALIRSSICNAMASGKSFGDAVGAVRKEVDSYTRGISEILWPHS